MRIADYSLAMQSSHSSSRRTTINENLKAWIGNPAPASAPPSNNQTVTLSSAAQQKQANDVAAADNGASNAQNDPQLQLLIFLIEKMTGLKVNVFDAGQLNVTQSATVSSATDSKPAQPQSAGFGLDYSKISSYSESEQTTMQASGIIKTSDGKEFKFSLNLTMQYQYSETISTGVHMGDAARKTDPLVVNFNGSAAQLSEQRFAFDLNSNGQKVQINAPSSGSGFLALDLNGDGKITNGNELFGPSTGNGFTELARYDSNRDGWIDQNDSVFQKLKVWTKNASGSDKLNSLPSLGIGAISLKQIATPFDIKTATNKLLGSIQSSSVSVNENGTTGNIQQIDLTV